MKKIRLEQKRFKRMFFLNILLVCICIMANSVSSFASQTVKSDIIDQVEEAKVTLKIVNMPMNAILKEIQSQTGIEFVYSSDIDPATMGNFTIEAEDKLLKDALYDLLKTTKYTYSISSDRLVIVLREESESTEQVDDKEEKVINKGRLVDESDNPIIGATIFIKNSTMGALTDANGEFSIEVAIGDILDISFVGMRSIEYTVTGAQNNLIFVMKRDVSKMDDVVVTGIFKRKGESYTGASETYTAKDLLRVGNQNIFQSLKNLDPSLYVMDDLDLGSDPNAMPNMRIRGNTSIDMEVSSTEFKGNYQNKPNQPLFILDGFEVSVEKMFDYDMNRIQSVTILKDAAAKALYGSKAANGVIILESKILLGDKPIVSYTGGVDITMPDLSSYNLTNAAEKLLVEQIDGMYTSDFSVDGQASLWNLYNDRAKLIAEGLDTYWLSKPLRTGVANKHNISVEVGNSSSLRASIDLSYNNSQGVMIGSDRTTITGTANISYRVKNFLFRNIMSITDNKSNDSPYGAYSEYTKMNPYWQAIDPVTNQVTRWAESGIPNPMYDALIGTVYQESYTNVTNNFYAEWNINKELKLSGRFSVDLKNSDADDFLPANHSEFANTYNINDILDAGSYTYEYGESAKVAFDLNLNYNKSINDHNIFANAGTFISDYSSQSVRSEAVGFPSNMGADLTFARQYISNETPQTFSSLIREISFLAFASYDYKSKYFAELTYRYGASSLYGRDNRWAGAWSAGIGWNIHKEKIFENMDNLRQFKLRTSYGISGNQNLNTNTTVTTYRYFTGSNYIGQAAAYMELLANNELDWEQREDFNVGLDFALSNFNLRFDYFDSVTHNAVATTPIVTSTGFEYVMDNIGKVNNRGYELYIGYTIFQNAEGFFNIFASGTTEESTLLELSDNMREYNEIQSAIAIENNSTEPVKMYYDGMNMNTIWAVQSLGIDPNTGNEAFLTRDGDVTYDYSALDLIAAGIDSPKYRGNLGFTAEYKGFGLSATFTFLGGGQLYNSTLVDRVENVDINYNVDKRVLEGRWLESGQVTQFKRLDNNNANAEKTQATTRFVQDRNEFDISSLSFYYEVPTNILKKTPFSRLKASLYMNDVYQFSSIQIERGLNYPFARTLSFSITAVL